MGMSRERVLELIGLMQLKTVANGCTPGEAAKFAAKCAEWVERYQIEEAELRAASAKNNGSSFSAEDLEVEICENILRTGKKIHNPGVTQVVNGLTLGMCCRLILTYRGEEAVYGIVGDPLDANYVCQISIAVVPALQTMARMEGAEHGYERAGLIQWCNQYLSGAGVEIKNRLEKERKERSDKKKITESCTALAVVTGDSLAIIKRNATEEAFKQLYPKTKETRSRQHFNREAYERGQAAGRRVGLNLAID